MLALHSLPQAERDPPYKMSVALAFRLACKVLVVTSASQRGAAFR